MYERLPNVLTMMRLVLAAVFFLTLNQYRYLGPGGDPQSAVLWASIVLFILAAITDYLDGYLARRWRVESRFGRIMDPFCDKVLVIGAFIYLAGPRFVIPHRAAEGAFFNMASGVYPWMVAVVLARELLVTAVRAELEGLGAKFGANLFGKWKMILQSITVPTVLLIIWLDPVRHEWTAWVRDAFVYTTILVTILSGIPYVHGAYEALRRTQREPPGTAGQ